MQEEFSGRFRILYLPEIFNRLSVFPCSAVAFGFDNEESVVRWNSIVESLERRYFF